MNWLVIENRIGVLQRFYEKSPISATIDASTDILLDAKQIPAEIRVLPTSVPAPHTKYAGHFKLKSLPPF